MNRRRPFAAVVTLALVAPVTTLTTLSPASAAPTPTTPTVSASPRGAAHLPHPTRVPATPASPYAGAAAGAPAGTGAGSAVAAHDPHAVLVRFAKSATATRRDHALQSRGAREANAVVGTGFVRVTTTGRADELASRLRADPAVAEVTLDYVREASATPNDYFYAGTREQEYLRTVRLPTAWDLSKGSLSQVVAVLDTGVNGKHPDLVGRTVAGFNAITNVGIPAGAASDDKGHGSMVAGIIAARTNDGSGIAGVAWNAKVMPVKVLAKTGKGTDSDVIQGLTWAADHGARIINLSLSGPDDSPALHAAVTYAVRKGAVVIAAAGNSGGDRPEYPAAYPEAIAVAATDTAGRVTDFSTHGSWVDVAAPGWDILSTQLGSDYFFNAGTSFSAPIVSGIAVLMRSKSPSMTPAQVAARLRSTARDAGPRGTDPFYGAGVVDATRALGGSSAPDFGLPAAAPDEPNDVPSRAIARESQGTSYSTIGAEGDVDWWRFDSSGQRETTFTVTPPPFDENAPQNVDPVLAVYDERLRLVAEVDQKAEGEPETTTVRLAAGRHYVTVRSFNGSRVGTDRSYGLEIRPGAAGVLNPAGRLASGTAYGPLALGDVDGDGRGDVVAGLTGTAPGGPAQLHVLRQKPAGGLGASVALATTGASLVRDLEVADVDGDGLRDVVVATDLGVQVFGQTPTHALAGPQVVADTAGATTVEVADLDGDGRADLVTSTAGEVAVLLAQPDGSWVRSVIDATGGADQLQVGDLDGDGRPDVAVSRGGALLVLRHTADGWASRAVPVPGDWGARGVAVADLDGNGRLDLAAVTGGNGPSARLLVWRQTADGALPASPGSTAVPDIPQPLEAADVTGDGRTDLVLGHGGWSTVSVVEQGANGALLPPSSSFADSPSQYDLSGLVVGDVTGDGRADVVAASWDGLDLLTNAGGPKPAGAQHPVRSTWPADFGSGLPVTTTPTVTFADEVLASTVRASTVRVLDNRSGATVPATVTYDSGRRTATVRPRSKLFDNAAFRLSVAGVRATSTGTTLAAYTSTFRTVDLAPPAVGSFTATGALRAARLTWRSPAANDLERYVVRMARGTVAPASVTAGTAVYSGTSASVTMPLAQGTTYSFKIWARDRTGHWSPSASGRLVGTSETIASSRTSIRRGSSVTLSSTVSRRDPSGPLAGAAVQLYWRKVGQSTWHLVTTRTSTSKGVVSYVHQPTATVDYMWVHRGSRSAVGSSSALRRVTVR
ncbi:S8 family serine peptidase [Terrabacter aeriphilus]|uniref:S8 family serine peptidase n=1 Tax=Terrabacter aeriphilus TaxID=515662 RepID=UPI0031E50A81